MPDRDPMVCPACGSSTEFWNGDHCGNDDCLIDHYRGVKPDPPIPLSAFLRARIAADLRRLAETGAPYPSALIPSGGTRKFSLSMLPFEKYIGPSGAKNAVLEIEYDPKGDDPSAFVSVEWPHAETDSGGFEADLSLEKIRELRGVLLSMIPAGVSTDAEYFARLPVDLQVWEASGWGNFGDYEWDAPHGCVWLELGGAAYEDLGVAETRLAAAKLIAAHRKGLEDA